MQSFDDREMRSGFESMKTSTKLALLAGVLLFLVGLTLLAVNGQYVDFGSTFLVIGSVNL